MEIRYEDLVRQPEPTLQRVCRFIDAPYSQRLLRYAESAAGEMPESSLEWHQTSIRPPDPTKVFAWKHKMTIADRMIFQEIAGDALELFAYELEEPRAPLRTHLRRFYLAAIKRW